LTAKLLLSLHLISGSEHTYLTGLTLTFMSILTLSILYLNSPENFADIQHRNEKQDEGSHNE
jgi:hypothetical protein